MSTQSAPVVMVWCSRCGRPLQALVGAFAGRMQQLGGTTCSGCATVLCDSCNPPLSRGGTVTCARCDGSLDPIFARDVENIHQKHLSVILAWCERFKGQPVGAHLGNRSRVTTSSAAEETPGGTFSFHPIADGRLREVETGGVPGHLVIVFDSHIGGRQEDDRFVLGYEVAGVEDDGDRLVIHKGSQIVRMVAHPTGLDEEPSDPTSSLPAADRPPVGYACEQHANCNGTGCGECNGQGQVFVKKPSRKCPTCGGRGHHIEGLYLGPTCEDCKGIGWVEAVLIDRTGETTSAFEELTLTGHTGTVYAAAITPDGSRVVSASSDKTLRVWDLASGETVHTLTGHEGAVREVAVTPDGSRAISASEDGALRVWDLASGETLHTLPADQGAISAVAVTPDGTRVVAGGRGGLLKVWALDSGEILHTLEGHQLWVRGVAVTPDGTRVVSVSLDGTLRVWDLASGKMVRTLDNGTWVSRVTVTPDGTRVLSGSSEQTLRVWDLASGETLHMLSGHTGHVDAVAVTPDGTRAVSGSDDHTLRVWDLASGATLHVLEAGQAAVRSVAVTPDGNRAVSVSDGKTLHVWDLASGERLQTLEGHFGLVSAVVVAPDGRRAISASADKTLRVWSLAQATTRPVEAPNPLDGSAGTARPHAMTLPDAVIHSADGVLVGHTKYVLSCAVSPDGTAILAGEVGYPEPGALRVWDVATGTCRHTLAGQTTDVRTPLVVGPDGTWFASAGGSTAAREFGLRIWDFATGSCRQTLTGHTASVHDCAVAPDGTWLVSASDDRSLRIWDVATGICRRVLVGHERSVYTCTVSPDGTWIVSAGMDGTVRVWDVATGVSRHVLAGHTDSDIKTGFAEVHACAVSPDGTWMVSAGGDATLRIWDVGTGACRHVLVGHTDAVFYVAVSPDGKWIVSGCNPVVHGKDLDLRLWDPATGACLQVLHGHTGWVTGVQVSPDGRWIVSSSRDGTLRIWDPLSGACLRSIEAHDRGVTAVVASPDSKWIVSAGVDATLRIWDAATGACQLPSNSSNVMTRLAASPAVAVPSPIVAGTTARSAGSRPEATSSPDGDLPSPPAATPRAPDMSKAPTVDEALLELDALNASLQASLAELTHLNDLRDAGKLTEKEHHVKVDEVAAKALAAIPSPSPTATAPHEIRAPSASPTSAHPKRRSFMKLFTRSHGDEVKFVRKYDETRTEPMTGVTGVLHYEIYKAPTGEAARAFLEGKTVSERLHYLVVETPEGDWGKDITGIYKE